MPLPCLLGNISYRTQHKVVWDSKSERITNYGPADALLTKQYRSPWRMAGLEG